LIGTHGLINLAGQVGVQPDDEAKAVIWEMFQASLHGYPYDAAKWGAYYKAYSSQFGEQTAPKAATKAATATPAIDTASIAARLDALKQRATQQAAA
jgi:hypothetical protein